MKIAKCTSSIQELYNELMTIFCKLFANNNLFMIRKFRGDHFLCLYCLTESMSPLEKRFGGELIQSVSMRYVVSIYKRMCKF